MLKRLTMVYDADRTIKGELSYWVGHHIIGNVSCSLCDISHGPFRQKQVWKEWVDEVARRGVAVVALHRNDLEKAEHADVAEIIAGRFPCVVGHSTDGSLTFHFSKAELEPCNGQVDAFAKLIEPLLPAKNL